MNVDFNTDADNIEVPNSKIKLLILLIGAIGFVALGIWFVTNPLTFMDTGYRDRPKFEIEAVGYTSIIFFGLCALVGLFKLFDNKPGLIINDEGIVINPNSPASLIRWNEIEKFDIKIINRTRLISIYLKDPDEYINRQVSEFKRKALMLTLKSFGTPLSISTNGLNCKFDDLYSFLNNKLNIKNR
jgi:hypothetical protein